MAGDTKVEINKIISRVNTHPEYSASVELEVREALLREASKHSVALEIEEGITNGVAEKKRVEGLRNLGMCWNYLSREGITLHSLSRLGGIIEPDKCSNFRQVEVVIGEVSPVPKEKVIYEMDDLVARLNFSGASPIDRATEAHIEVARIHPYVDGNGRAARLLESFCLQERGLPPAVIVVDDKAEYTSLLRRTLYDRSCRESSLYEPSNNELLFRNFISSKILSSARHLEGQLRSRRFYDITITGIKERSIAMTLRNLLGGLGRCPSNGGVAVALKQGKKKRSYNFTMVGNVGLEEVRAVLEKAKGHYGIRYEAVPRKGCCL